MLWLIIYVLGKKIVDLPEMLPNTVLATRCYHPNMNTMSYITFLFLFRSIHYVTLSRAINLSITQNIVMNSGEEPTGSSDQQQPPFFLGQGCANPEPQDAVVPNICAFSVWNLILVTLLVPIIMRWLLAFGKFVQC
jgi:hypothetical protein